MSLKKKWGNLISSIDNLNLYLYQNLQLTERLTQEDWTLLKDISNNINPKALNYKKLKNNSSDCEKLKETFFVKYMLYYNLKDDSTVDNFPDDWAQKIFKSLTCTCEN